ncbi:MAG: DUF362 domain-containing protein [Desulfosarcinaceae bacterium]|jgi:uncharacterized protein (DUF362 family)/ferredoxin
MNHVWIEPASYDGPHLKRLIYAMLDRLPKGAIGPGKRVLIKPNLLVPAVPEQAATTHPLVVAAVAEFACELGAQVTVADSPVAVSADRVLRKGGYLKVLEGLPVRTANLEATIPVEIGDPFGLVPMAEAVMRSDVVLNLAKLKTHTQMLLSLGVKNLFGCVVGMEKARWHLRTGIDRLQFASLLARICAAVQPAYTIVDGILAMEGQGPGLRGEPRDFGLLVGGDNPFAVDKAICLLLGLEPHRLPTSRQAEALALFDGQVHIHGDVSICHDFNFPDLGPLSAGQTPLQRWMRRHLIQRPVADNRRCKLCRACWELCPAKVIGHDIRGIQIDAEGCIRCYCCIEVCPHGAITAKQPLLGRLFNRYLNRKLTSPED